MKNLEEKIGYTFKDKELLKKALTHTSYAYEHEVESNEKLEFLGVKKPVVKAHGSSDEKLFEFKIKQAEKFVENKAVDKMIEAFEKNA